MPWRWSADRRERHRAVSGPWLRGVSALPNVFAHESFMDELAPQTDPVALRLRNRQPSGVGC
jgi:hypothetical protein